MNGEMLGSGMADWIWDTMISMTLLMAVVLILRKPVSHYFGPKIAYLLWILPFARLFMPTLTLEAPAPAEVMSPIISGSTASDLLLAGPVDSLTAGAASVDWMMIAMILWLGGAGLLFLSKLGAYFQFREDIITDGQLVGQHGNIKILETAAVGGPLAFGLFRKYIAVPTNFFRNYAPLERELALEHEIAHHESGDLAANFAGLLVLSLHWFNPVAWFAWIAFRQDQETACDARILQQSGQDVRAVYGRTIAKSASGHRLGLASPLNQKDKIKNRLKMLGQSEKSGFRKYLGATLVAAGTVIALPLTATVTYAVEIDPAEDFSPVIPKAPKAPAAPDAPAAPVAPKGAEVVYSIDDGKATNITLLGGDKEPLAGGCDVEHVHKIKHQGRTVILRTKKHLNKEDLQELVAEAEESRLEAEEARLEKRFDREELREEMREVAREIREAQLEAQEAQREVEMELREMERELNEVVRQAKHDALRVERNAKHEARWAAHAERTAKRQAEHEARWGKRNAVHDARQSSHSASDSQTAVPVASTISFKSSAISRCKAMGQTIAFGGQAGVIRDRAWASVAGCRDIRTGIDHRQLMNITLRSLKERRAAAVKSCKNPDAKLRRDLQNYDRAIEKLQKRLQIV